MRAPLSTAPACGAAQRALLHAFPAHPVRPASVMTTIIVVVVVVVLGGSSRSNTRILDTFYCKF
jgi:hypothetical protein